VWVGLTRREAECNVSSFGRGGGWGGESKGVWCEWLCVMTGNVWFENVS